MYASVLYSSTGHWWCGQLAIVIKMPFFCVARSMLFFFLRKYTCIRSKTADYQHAYTTLDPSRTAVPALLHKLPQKRKLQRRPSGCLITQCIFFQLALVPAMHLFLFSVAAAERNRTPSVVEPAYAIAIIGFEYSICARPCGRELKYCDFLYRSRPLISPAFPIGQLIYKLIGDGCFAMQQPD